MGLRLYTHAFLKFFINTREVKAKWVRRIWKLRCYIWPNRTLNALYPLLISRFKFSLFTAWMVSIVRYTIGVLYSYVYFIWFFSRDRREMRIARWEAVTYSWTYVDQGVFFLSTLVIAMLTKILLFIFLFILSHNFFFIIPLTLIYKISLLF